MSKVWKVSGTASTIFYGDYIDDDIALASLTQYVKNAEEEAFNNMKKKEINKISEAPWKEAEDIMFCLDDDNGSLSTTDFTMEDYFEGIQKTNKIAEKMKKLGWDFDDIDQFSEDLAKVIDEE